MLRTQEDYKICGLVGAAGRLGAKEESAFKDLLKLDAIRGEDSTGVAAVDSKTDVIVEKAVGNPYDFLTLRRVEKVFHRTNRVLIGHNRWATSGVVNKNNAHPFEFNTLVGVHNGTLKNRHNLKFLKDYTVDSEQLYANIEEDGIDVALQKTEGAYALVWWDKVGMKLHMVRNIERPLYYTTTLDKKIIFWASEKWMLEIALYRHDVKHSEVHSIVPNQLHTFDIDPEAVWKNAPDLVPHVRPVVPKPVVHYLPPVTPPNPLRASVVSGHGARLKPIDERPTINEKRMKEYVKVTTDGVHVDYANNKYLIGVDVHGIEEYRLYSTDFDRLKELSHSTFRAKIFGYSPTLKYYLLGLDSVLDAQKVEHTKEKKEEDVEPVGVEEDDECSRVLIFPVLDHQGREVSEITFYYRYSECAHCGADIEYGEKYKPLDRNTALCSKCMESK